MAEETSESKLEKNIQNLEKTLDEMVNSENFPSNIYSDFEKAYSILHEYAILKPKYFCDSARKIDAYISKTMANVVLGEWRG